MSLTPRVEIFFRDEGYSGNLEEVLSKANRPQKYILKLLHATRKFNLAHYTPTGVKLTTGAAKPSIEILTGYDE